MKQKLIEFYMDWANNWFTIGKFADYYGFEVKDAEALIEIGRKYHNEQVEQNKP